MVNGRRVTDVERWVMPSKTSKALLVSLLVIGLYLGATALLEDPARKDDHGPAQAPPPGRNTHVIAEEDSVPSAAPVCVSAFDERRELDQQVGRPWTPEYGPLLRRSGSRATILLEDDRGDPLVRSGMIDPKVRTWRQDGAYWQEQESRLRWSDRTLAEAAPVGALEPGDYETVVSLGSYGVASARYQVARDQDTTVRVRMPGWRRVVTLKIVDQAGRPVPYLSSPPTYRPSLSATIQDRPAKSRVLRSPPGVMPGITVSGKSSRYHGRRGRPRRRLHRHRTDSGRYHLEVIAGVAGRITIPMDRRWFVTPTVSLKGDFAGPEWEAYEVRVELKHDYHAAVLEVSEKDAGDPGARSLLDRTTGTAAPRANVAGDPFRKPTMPGMGRIVISADPSGRVEPFYDYRSNKRRGPRRWSPGEWATELHPKAPASVSGSDGAFYRTAPISVRPRANEVVSVQLAPAPWPCVLTASLSPTLNQWGSTATFALHTADESARRTTAATGAVRRADLYDGGFRYDTGLTEDWRQAILDNARLVCGFSGHTGRGLRYDHPTGTIKGSPQLRFSVDLTAAERESLASGALHLDLASRMQRKPGRTLLAFRCVGDSGEGLPWVEGTVIRADQDQAAQATRRASKALTRDAIRPGTDHVRDAAEPGPASEPVLQREQWPEIEDEIPIQRARSQAPPMPPFETLKRRLPPGLADRYGDEGLRRLWRHGAWYDTRARLTSDPDGYVIAPGAALESGERYVLYLWSRSTDDLEPDRRIVFEAGGTITDLGLIRLPSR